MNGEEVFFFGKVDFNVLQPFRSHHNYKLSQRFESHINMRYKVSKKHLTKNLIKVKVDSLVVINLLTK